MLGDWRHFLGIIRFFGRWGGGIGFGAWEIFLPSVDRIRREILDVGKLGVFRVGLVVLSAVGLGCLDLRGFFLGVCDYGGFGLGTFRLLVLVLGFGEISVFVRAINHLKVLGRWHIA